MHKKVHTAKTYYCIILLCFIFVYIYIYHYNTEPLYHITHTYVTYVLYIPHISLLLSLCVCIFLFPVFHPRLCRLILGLNLDLLFLFLLVGDPCDD